MKALSSKAEHRSVSEPITFWRDSFIMALNALSAHRFNGKISYAIYRNSQAVDHVLQKFQKRMNKLMVLHAKLNPDGSIMRQATKESGGRELPVFKTPENEQAYYLAFNTAYRSDPKRIDLVLVDEELIREALQDAEPIEPAALNALRCMFITLEDKNPEPDEEVSEQNVPSTHGTDPQLSGTGAQAVQSDPEEPQAVNLPEPAESARDAGDGELLRSADHG